MAQEVFSRKTGCGKWHDSAVQLSLTSEESSWLT